MRTDGRMGVSDSGISGDREFPLTSWSAIRNAQDPGSPEYQRHLHRLIELYWRPVYSVIRHGWGRSHDDAKDLTQEFFAQVILDRELARTYEPARGSFRGLLRAAITSFMRMAVRDAARLKRGGGKTILSLDAFGEGTVEGMPDAEGLAPEEIFDRAWNASVMAQAIALLERKLVGDGKAQVFEVFRRYDLDPDPSVSYAELGTALDLSPAQVKHALIQARGALREIVTDVVRGYVDGPDDLAVELRRLLGP